MADRNFHTALVGGFRKKDVVNFLAEDKRRQTEELEELRRRVELLEQELDKARSEQADVQDLEEQVTQALQAQEEAKNMAEQARQAQAEARAMAQQARRDQAAAQAMAAKERQAREEAERRLADSVHEKRRLADQLLEEQLGQQLGQSVPAPPPRGKQVSAQQREDAWSQSRQDGLYDDSGEGQTLRLRDLCGKLERTLNQVDRILGGSYRVVCYPENGEEDDLEEEVRRSQGIPVPPSEPRQERSTVGEILQRVRPRK